MKSKINKTTFKTFNAYNKNAHYYKFLSWKENITSKTLNSEGGKKFNVINPRLMKVYYQYIKKIKLDKTLRSQLNTEE